MLGFEIFHRGTRGLQMTAQGSVLVHGAQLLLRELVHVEAEAEAAGSDGGLAAVLRLGASGFLAVGLIPPVVARLTSRVPPLAVRLREDTVPRLFESLLAGDLDALITLYNHDVMAGTAGRDIWFEKISEEGYAVIAPSGHRMTRARSVSWKMLAEAPCVLTRKPSLARVFLEDSFRRHGLTPPVPICETNGPITAARMVAAGVGPSSVPETIAKDALKSQAVSLVKLQTPQPTATLGLVCRSSEGSFASAGIAGRRVDRVRHEAAYSDSTEKPVLQMMAGELRFSSTCHACSTSINRLQYRCPVRGVNRASSRASFVLLWLIAMAYAA